MRHPSLILLPALGVLLTACTWAENDLDHGLAYGSNQERLVRKITVTVH